MARKRRLRPSPLDAMVAHLKSLGLEPRPPNPALGSHRELTLTSLERRYVATRSPVYVYEAWGACREEGWRVPKWVVDYLDRVSDEIVKLADQVRAEGTSPSAGQVAMALEFASLGRGTAWSKMTEFEADLALDDEWRRLRARARAGLLPREGRHLSKRRALELVAEGKWPKADAAKRSQRVDALKRRVDRATSPIRKRLARGDAKS